MKRIIFNDKLEGHNLEFINHIYNYSANDKKNEYIFIIPKEFESLKDNYSWKEGSNSTFQFIRIEDILRLEKVHNNLIKYGWRISKLLGNLQKKNNADEIILINLAPFIPFLPFFLKGKVKVKGIIYSISLYSNSKKKKIIDWFRYKVAVSSKNFSDIFILNDSKSSAEYNRIFKTEKFKYLPDPIPDISKIPVKDLREELCIPKENKIFLHFGALDRRKGTLEILEAINLIPKDFKGTFIFGGKVKDTIKEEYEALTQKLINQGRSIILLNEFVSEKTMCSLYYTSDCILIPYLNTQHSSGVLGYAAFFNKPVIGPSEGLIGRLIKNYKLGYLLDKINQNTLSNILIQFKIIKINNSYYQSHTIDGFLKILFRKTF